MTVHIERLFTKSGKPRSYQNGFAMTQVVRQCNTCGKRHVAVRSMFGLPGTGQHLGRYVFTEVVVLAVYIGDEALCFGDWCRGSCWQVMRDALLAGGASEKHLDEAAAKFPLLNP